MPIFIYYSENNKTVEKKDDILTILSAGPVYINSEIYTFENRKICTSNLKCISRPSFYLNF